jgi:transposase
MRVAPRYSEQFKADAVALLAASDRSCRQVAEDLGLCDETLRDWYKKSQMGKGTRKKQSAKVVAAEKALGRKPESLEAVVERQGREIAALRKENESLQQDREILKKAAAFFAKESE